MAKDENKTITVDGVDHNVSDLDEQQVAMVNHISDLDRKIANARFNLDQLNVGRDAFVSMLAKALNTPEEAA